MFAQARQIISTALAIGAVLLVLWIIGTVASHDTVHGLAAVGAGIHWVFTSFTTIISGI